MSVLTSLTEAELVLLGGYSETIAEAGNSKIAAVFQMSGIDPLTQEMVDVSNLSAAVTDDNSWILSSVNAGLISASTRPSEGTPVSMGTGLSNLKTEFANNSNQLVYNYSTPSDVDLQAFYEMALSISAQVGSLAPTSAVTSLTTTLDSINSQDSDTATACLLYTSPSPRDRG